jgi:hypothetical protein
MTVWAEMYFAIGCIILHQPIRVGFESRVSFVRIYVWPPDTSPCERVIDDPTNTEMKIDPQAAGLASSVTS